MIVGGFILEIYSMYFIVLPQLHEKKTKVDKMLAAVVLTHKNIPYDKSIHIMPC